MTATRTAGGLLLLAVAGGAAWATASPGMGMSATDPPPRLLSVSYGRLRAPGAGRAANQLRLRVVDGNGQVIGVAVTVLGAGGTAIIADGGCGLGGRRNGRPATDYLPVTLRPGSRRLRIRLTSTRCTNHTPGRLQRTTTVRRLRVR